MITDPEAAREWLVAQAQSGNRLVHDVLCAVAERLTANEMYLPPWLQRYVVVAAKQGPTHRKRGAPTNNLARDQAIIWVLLVIAVRYDLDPTRNPGSTIECACSIVAAAFDRFGTDGMSETNLNRIWAAQDGKALLIQEMTLTASFGPNLWILSDPMGRVCPTPENPVVHTLAARLNSAPSIGVPAC